jgi:hypothetical protein
MTDGKRDDRRDLGLLASRFIRAGAEAVVQTSEKIRERSEELNPRDFVRGAAGLTARGKDEVMALIAREVRNYIDHLGLITEIERLASTYSLDVNASFRLRPLNPEEDDPEGDESEGDESDSEVTEGEDGEATSPSPPDSEA